MATDNDDDDTKLNAVEGADESGEVVSLEGDDAAEGKKKPAAKPPVQQAATDDDGGEEEDSRVSNEDEDEDDEAERSGRPRETSAQRRARQRAARESAQREMNLLRSRNEELERRFSGVEQRMLRTEYGSLEAQIAEVDANLRKADEVYAKAIEVAAGADAAEAQNIKMQLLGQRNALVGRQQQLQQAARQQQQPRNAAPPAPDPDVVRNAQRWFAKNPWANERGEDALVARAIDQAVVDDGFDPKSPEYWQELDARLARRLPHRYARGGAVDDGNREERTESRQRTEQRRDPPPRMPSGGQQALKPNEVWVSPERKRAMQEAGVWDDVKARNRMLKRYAQYDREARESAG